jgi:hypothetical protein
LERLESAHFTKEFFVKNQEILLGQSDCVPDYSELIIKEEVLIKEEPLDPEVEILGDEDELNLPKVLARKPAVRKKPSAGAKLKPCDICGAVMRAENLRE